MPLPLAALPAAPPENAPMNAARESREVLDIMARRRSTKIAHFVGPGPTGEEIDAMIRLAARVPDHGKLGPWRFVVIEGDARARAGQAVAEAITGDADSARSAAARALFLRSPACVMVVSTAAPHPKIPEWEQQLSSGAVCFSLLMTAHAAGYAACWITEWPAYDARARTALGLADHERVAGFVHLGSAREQPTERVRADAGQRISRL